MARVPVLPAILSGSINGLGIKVVATASAGTLIHTATAVAGEMDRVWLSVYNSDTVARELTIQWGGTTSPDNDIKETIAPKEGERLVVAGRLLAGGLVVRAYASVGSVLIISGEVERATVT